MPDELRARMGMVVRALLGWLEKYKKHVEGEGNKEQKEGQDDGEGEDDDGMDDYYDDFGGEGEGEGDFDGDFEGDFVPKVSNANYYKGMFKQLLAPIYFKNSMENISQNSPDVYTEITQLIPEEKQEMLQFLFDQCGDD